MSFRNTLFILPFFIIFACTKDVGKDAKLHPEPAPYVSPHIGKYAVNVALHNEQWSGIGLMWKNDTVFKDTLNISYNSGTGKTTFKYLYSLSQNGAVVRQTGNYVITGSGTYSVSTFLDIILRRDSLFYFYDYNMNKTWDRQTIIGGKLK